MKIASRIVLLRTSREARARGHHARSAAVDQTSPVPTFVDRSSADGNPPSCHRSTCSHHTLGRIPDTGVRGPERAQELVGRDLAVRTPRGGLNDVRDKDKARTAVGPARARSKQELRARDAVDQVRTLIRTTQVDSKPIPMA